MLAFDESVNDEFNFDQHRMIFQWGAENWFRLNLVVLVRVNAQRQIRFHLSKCNAFSQRFTGHPMDTQHKHTHRFGKRVESDVYLNQLTSPSEPAPFGC